MVEEILPEGKKRKIESYKLVLNEMKYFHSTAFFMMSIIHKTDYFFTNFS